MEAISKGKGDPLLDGGRPSDDPEGRTIQSLSGDDPLQSGELVGRAIHFFSGTDLLQGFEGPYYLDESKNKARPNSDFSLSNK